VAQAVFAERYDVADDFPLLQKADRLAVKDTGPVPVQTQRIDPEPTLPAAKQKTAEHESEAGRPRERKRDLCERHNMHKVWVTSRRWRCRR